MNDAFGMGGIQSVGQFGAKLGDLLGGKGLARDTMGERHASEQLHGDEGLTLVFVHFEDGADVGVVQGRGGARFPSETTECLGMVDDVISQELQGNEAVKLGVLGLVDHTHAAASELLDDAVVRYGLADHEWPLKLWGRRILGRCLMEVKASPR